MTAMHPFAGLEGDHPRPRLAGLAAGPGRPVPAPGSLRRLEPLAAVFLGLHGLVVLANLDGAPWQWAAVGLVALSGLAGLGGRGPSWTVPLRGWAILVVGVALQATAGGWFLAWTFVLVAVYPLALPGPAGAVVAGLAVLGYVLVVRLASPAVAPALAVTRGALLAGLAGLALTVAGAYARMASAATDASLELGRRERLERALLEALPDPTSVLDAQGRVLAVNQAWTRLGAGRRAGLAAGVGESCPAACAAAAEAGYDGLEAAAGGIRAVLGGGTPSFRCRYRAPGDGLHQLTVLPLADGGAVVTSRPAPSTPA